MGISREMELLYSIRLSIPGFLCTSGGRSTVRERLICKYSCKNRLEMREMSTGILSYKWDLINHVDVFGDISILDLSSKLHSL